MKALLSRLTSHLSRLTARGHATAANDATAPDIYAVNEAAYGVDETGVMIVPFGEVPVMVSVNGRKVRGLQRIDAIAGNEMAADMTGIMGLIKSAFMGRPIFLGHPYHPDATEAAKYPDKRARGFVKSVEVANDSIRLIPKYNKLGAEEVTDQQMIFHSPQWRMRPVMAANGQQEVKDGMPVFRPYSLHSGGLTNNPNIPVPPLMGANEEEGQPGQDGHEAKLAELTAERDALQAANEALSTKNAELQTQLSSATEAHAANESQLETLNLELGTLREAHAAARAAHVDAVLLPLITSGKVTGADKDAIRAELISAANEAAIDERLTQLANQKPKLGTTGGVTDALRQGTAKLILAANEQSARSHQRNEAVSDALAEITQGLKAKPGDQEKAWNLAQSRNPALFAR